MTPVALTFMVVTETVITLTTLYFFWKVLRSSDQKPSE